LKGLADGILMQPWSFDIKIAHNEYYEKSNTR